MDLKVAAAKYALGNLRSEEAISAASSALDRGVYSKSLGLLFYEVPVWHEVERLFTRALSELDIPVPSRDEASLIVAGDYCRQILAGDISPYEGASRIWNVRAMPGSSPCLSAFVGLASEWEDAEQFPDPLDRRAECDSAIIEEAERLVNGECGG